MNKIEVKALLPTKDFKELDQVDITIKQHDYKPSDKDIMFEYTLPKYIYDELVDTEEKYQSYQTLQKKKKEIQKTGYRSFKDDTTNYFSKSIKYPLISLVLDKLNEYVNDLMYIKSKKNDRKEKKIFIKFSHSSRVDKCNWTFGYKGLNVASSFQYFIGYKVYNDNQFSINKPPYTYETYERVMDGMRQKDGIKSGEVYTEKELQPLIESGGSVSQFEKSYSIVDWSEESEEFLKNIQDKFINLNMKLDEFLCNIDNDKMKWLIDNSSFVNKNLLGK